MSNTRYFNDYVQAVKFIIDSGRTENALQHHFFLFFTQHWIFDTSKHSNRKQLIGMIKNNYKCFRCGKGFIEFNFLFFFLAKVIISDKYYWAIVP